MPYPRRNFLKDIGAAGIATLGGGLPSLFPGTPYIAIKRGPTVGTLPGRCAVRNLRTS